ncbi:hypothetical protein H5410_027362 [Solanum commersonii]|uniref:Uncharacterized protein n=1 Tax=Solanum commersonii TaxID=4109 RepID=A0A9J5Z487_SOLCO|nr:hypothetical protein H5410_027362 [Solanum commersonii]
MDSSKRKTSRGTRVNLDSRKTCQINGSRRPQRHLIQYTHLPAGFKTPKFEKYDGYGDPIGHLKKYCNQLRGDEGKEREQAARVKPSMKESEIIDDVLQAQEPDYFHYLLSAVEITFIEVIKVGEMVENGIKSGKYVSQAVLKAITQVLQNGYGNLGGKKRREVVATIVPAPQIYVQDNHPQHIHNIPSPTLNIPYLAHNQLLPLLIAMTCTNSSKSSTTPTTSPKYC